MKRKKLTVDLGNTPLTDAQHKKLLADVHAAVKANLKKVLPAAKPAKPAPKKRLAAAPAPALTATATISATFTNVNPGLSELNATFNGKTQQITQTGTITINNIRKGDAIMIDGKSLGTADISIDLKASPQQMKFAPGTFNFMFFIL